MATIAITAAQTGFANVSKTFNLADASMNLMVQAYQADANVAVNGVATRAQVLNYITGTWAQAVRDKIQAFQTVVTVPPPVSIT